MTLWTRLLDKWARAAYAGLPQPIAPDAQREACLCEACECCANPAADVPAEACGVCHER